MLINGDCCCQTEQDTSKRHESRTQPQSLHGQARPPQDTGLTVHGSSPYVNIPEERPHGHTELLDEDGYLRAVCDYDNEDMSRIRYDNVNPIEPESHQPRPEQNSCLAVHGSSPYANDPEEQPHGHTEVLDDHGYLLSVCNHDNEHNIMSTHL